MQVHKLPLGWAGKALFPTGVWNVSFAQVWGKGAKFSTRSVVQPYIYIKK